MADREALRDFQRRLAGRLQAASTQGVQAAWLAVQTGGARFLIPLAHAGEIFPEGVVHPVPYTRPWFLGVASLRGALHGVVDLARLVAPPAARLPHGASPASPASPVASGAAAATTEAQWITLSAALDVQCAVRVDQLVGLRGPEAYATSGAAAPGAPDCFGPIFHDAGGASWQTLDLQRLSQQPQFLDIGTRGA